MTGRGPFLLPGWLYRGGGRASDKARAFPARPRSQTALRWSDSQPATTSTAASSIKLPC